ncbi:hypothetical protein Tco_0810376 [Tanacetum coccineum]
MSNTNNTLQTQTSNSLHNAIMESGGKDRPPMLASGNYVQWKSRLKRYIKTKPNKEILHYCLANPPHEFQWINTTTKVAEDGTEITKAGHMETYHNVSKKIRDQLDTKAETVQIILTGIDNDIYSAVDACPNACEMWKAIERLKQGESINVQDLDTNLYLEFGKFTSRDGESLESYYSRFYKMINELVRNKSESRVERQSRTANLLALVAQQQPVYHPQSNPTHYTQNSSTRTQQVANRNSGKAIANPPPSTYDQAPVRDIEDDEMSKEKEIDKLIALISLSFKKIYKPTNNNLKTTSNTSRANQDNSPRTNKGTGYDNQRAVNVTRARETIDDAANSRPIFDVEPLQKVQYDDDNYNVFANDRQHPEQPESVNDTYLVECSDSKVITVSLDIRTNRGEADQDNDDDDLAKERVLLASLIDKLKCEIDESKNRNKLLESSNKILVDKLKSQIEDFRNKNICLESSNTF